MNDSQHDRRYRKSPRLGAIVKSLVIRFSPCRAGTRRSRVERSEVRFVSRLEPAELRFEFRLRPFTTFGDVFVQDCVISTVVSSRVIFCSRFFFNTWTMNNLQWCKLGHYIRVLIMTKMRIRLYANSFVNRLLIGNVLLYFQYNTIKDNRAKLLELKSDKLFII